MNNRKENHFRSFEFLYTCKDPIFDLTNEDLLWGLQRLVRSQWELYRTGISIAVTIGFSIAFAIRSVDRYSLVRLLFPTLLTAMYLEDPIGDLMIAGNSLSQSLLSLLPSCRCQVPLTLQPATISRRPHVLFQNEHSAGGLIGACLEGVEIDAAGNGLSDLVCAVPIGCGFSAQIARRFLHAEIQLPH